MKGQKRQRFSNLMRMTRKTVARDIKEKKKEANLSGDKVFFYDRCKDSFSR